MNPSDDSPGACSDGRVVKVAIDSRVEFSRRDVGGRTSFIAHHPATGKYFQFGPQEYRVASLLDGDRSIEAIVNALHEDGIDWQVEEVAAFISQLVRCQLAKTIDAPSASAAAASPAKQSLSTRIPGLLAFVVSQRIPLFHADRVAAMLQRPFGRLFTTPGMLAWCGLVLSGLMIVAFHRDDFADELRRMFDPSIWVVLLVLWVFAKVIHEAGHAVAARFHQVRVGHCGILFFFLAPLAYVDVTDAWKLRDRWSRIQIALGGVYFELGVAALAAWAWWILPDGLPRHLAAQFFLIAGPATLLVNANPLLRLDGYYVVSDLTEIPNLRMHGRTQLAGLLERLLMRIDPPKPLLSGWRRRFATVHAACSVVFQVGWMTGLIVGVSMWAEGLGWLLAIAAILLWGVLPLARWSSKIWMLDATDTTAGEERTLERFWRLGEKRKRLIGLAVLLLLVGQYLVANTSPFARRIPVIVRFHEPQIARASSDAFVTAVYVQRGERVQRGTILVELEDPELILRHSKLEDDLQIAERRSVQLRRQGELAQSAAESELAESLRRQLAEVTQQVHDLTVIAERSGIVLTPSSSGMLGRFFRQGEELLRISDPQEKELLAAVAQSDMRAYQAAARESSPATIRLRGGTTFTAIPNALRPRAKRSLPHPALAATVGGPLPVEPSPGEDDHVRLTEPQLQGLTLLDPVTSSELQDGQIGMMTIADNRSLVFRVWDSLTR